MGPVLAISVITGPGDDDGPAELSGTIGAMYRDLRVKFRRASVSAAGRVTTEVFEAFRPPNGESKGKNECIRVEGV